MKSSTIPAAALTLLLTTVPAVAQAVPEDVAVPSSPIAEVAATPVADEPTPDVVLGDGLARTGAGAAATAAAALATLGAGAGLLARSRRRGSR
ncbi:hypothetical protein [Oerskovia enterophila]|uniref:Gram-positive cocci surface proteins LPxTG domain-containing protein n=1 Tax=Oerskovia enterophila TaxID=43678 RepID=A0A163R196_9CELL|nr:hypothetical protein [Oerskovia enterophila]KZM34750.1 hypothetical protein OJAG_25560 [Oerskovia enterophila]